MNVITQHGSDLIEPILGSLSTLVAAFIGAWFAFGLESRRRDRETKNAHVISANLAIFSFTRAHNTFLNIKSQIIAEFEKHPARHHFIKPMMGDSLQKVQIDFSSLAFLLSTNPDLLGEIAITEQDINGTIDLIRDRSKLHYEHLQPAIERLQREGRETITTEQIDAELGPRAAQQLILATGYMIDGINRAIESTKQMAITIADTARKDYPGQKFISIAE